MFRLVHTNYTYLREAMRRGSAHTGVTRRTRADGSREAREGTDVE